MRVCICSRNGLQLGCELEDLILAAIKDAQAKAAEKAQEEMGKLTEGLGLPKDMKFPF